MRRILLITVFAFATINSHAQDASNQEYSILVADVDIMQLEDLMYIEIVGQQKVVNPFKFKVFVEYGQKNFTFKEQSIRDMSKGQFANGTGKRLAFNGMIDALNFFESRGWDYVNQYAVTVGNQNVYHILLKREE